MTDDLRLIEGCRATGSSGCHRYDYWNEQALFDGRPDTGWCTPSRTRARLEYLEVELPRTAIPLLLRLQHRPIEGHLGFPTSIRVYSCMSSPWNEVPATPAPTTGRLWHAWRLSPAPARRIRLEVDDIQWRPEGKYFVQFMQLELHETAERLTG
ncbi:hypothetical protein GCM10022221_49480 [Actinocorallia aurea]